VALAVFPGIGVPDRAEAAEIGQPAPDFKLPSTFGQDIALSDFRGKKFVLIEFYGADFAPT
jgi:peroxiredoxin